MWDTIGLASSDLLSFVSLFGICFGGFAVFGRIAFGPHMREYHDLPSSLMSLFRMLVGAYDYDTMLRASPRMAPLFLFAFLSLCVLVLTNFFIAVLSDAAQQTKAKLTEKEYARRSAAAAAGEHVDGSDCALAGDADGGAPPDAAGARADAQQPQPRAHTDIDSALGATPAGEFHGDIEYDLIKVLRRRLRGAVPRALHTGPPLLLPFGTRVSLVDARYLAAARASLRRRLRAAVLATVICNVLMRWVRTVESDDEAAEAGAAGALAAAATTRASVPSGSRAAAVRRIGSGGDIHSPKQLTRRATPVNLRKRRLSVLSFVGAGDARRPSQPSQPGAPPASPPQPNALATSRSGTSTAPDSVAAADSGVDESKAAHAGGAAGEPEAPRDAGDDATAAKRVVYIPMVTSSTEAWRVISALAPDSTVTLQAPHGGAERVLLSVVAAVSAQSGLTVDCGRMGRGSHARTCVVQTMEGVIAGDEALSMPVSAWLRYCARSVARSVVAGARAALTGAWCRSQGATRLLEEDDLEALLVANAGDGETAGTSARLDELVREIRTIILRRKPSLALSLSDRLVMSEACAVMERFRNCLIRNARDARGYTYEPNPVDTRGERLPASLVPLVDLMANHSHDVWARNLIDKGWQWAHERDNDKKLHPQLIAWSQMSDSDKKYDRDSATQSLLVIQSMGYNVKVVSSAETREAHAFGTPAPRGQTYDPRPFDTSAIDLPPGLENLVLMIADNNHGACSSCA